MKRILFVCMGNICRSPSAEGVFRKHVFEAGLENQIKIDSAGTHQYHVGEFPDSRAIESALNRGIDISLQRSRAVKKNDFTDFDLIFAMDEDNLRLLNKSCPQKYQYKLHLLLEYTKQSTREVPDPYYGGSHGFETVLDLLESASIILLEKLKKENLGEC